MFVDVLGYTIILPLLPFYAAHMGATPMVIGVLLASYGFCQMIAGPVLGRMSDRAGRKPVLLFSQLGTFAGFLLLAFAQDIRVVFVSRIIDGLTAGNLSVAQACIADVTEPKDRARAFGLIGISFGLGFLVGPAISGTLSHFGPQYPILFAAFLSLLSVLATFFLLPASEKKVESGLFKLFDFPLYKKMFSMPETGNYLRQFFFFIFAFCLFISGFALFAAERFVYEGHPFGAREVSYIFAFAGLLGVIVQGPLLAVLVRQFGEKKLVFAGFISLSLSFLMLGFISGIPLLLLTVSLSFLGSSLLRPSLTSLILQKVDKMERGAVMGLTQSLMSVSQVITPLIGGALIQHKQLVPWALLGAVVSGIGIFFR